MNRVCMVGTNCFRFVTSHLAMDQGEIAIRITKQRNDTTKGTKGTKETKAKSCLMTFSLHRVGVAVCSPGGEKHQGLRLERPGVPSLRNSRSVAFLALPFVPFVPFVVPLPFAGPQKKAGALARSGLSFRYRNFSGTIRS